TVNAAPGYSEHHGGDALDIGTTGESPAEESFEHTAAFAWLQAHAGRFGFALSYPRDNPHGITYEPWHWRYAGSAAARLRSASAAPEWWRRHRGRRSSTGRSLRRCGTAPTPRRAAPVA